MAQRYRVEWTYEGSSSASYDTYALAGAERYPGHAGEDPIAQDVRIVEAGPEALVDVLSRSHTCSVPARRSTACHGRSVPPNPIDGPRAQTHHHGHSGRVDRQPQGRGEGQAVGNGAMALDVLCVSQGDTLATSKVPQRCLRPDALVGAQRGTPGAGAWHRKQPRPALQHGGHCDRYTQADVPAYAHRRPGAHVGSRYREKSTARSVTSMYVANHCHEPCASTAVSTAPSAMPMTPG